MNSYWVYEYFNCTSTETHCYAAHRDALEAGYARLFADNNRCALTEDTLGRKVRMALESDNYWELQQNGDSLRIRRATPAECDRFNEKGY